MSRTTEGQDVPLPQLPRRRRWLSYLAVLASIGPLGAAVVDPLPHEDAVAGRSVAARPVGSVALKMRPAVPSATPTRAVVVVRLAKRPSQGVVKVKEGRHVLGRSDAPSRRRFKVTVEVAGLREGSHDLRAVYRTTNPRGHLVSDRVAVRSLSGCAPVPHLCGFPDATNTGPRPGTAQRSVPDEVDSGPGWSYDPRGWIEVGDGGRLTEVECECGVSVTGSNALIADSTFVVSGEGFGVALRHTTDVTIRNNIIRGPVADGPSRLLVGVKDIYGDSTGLEILANDFSMSSTGVQVEAGLVADNYIHDLGFTEGDHTNGTTSNGGTRPLELRHNTVFNPFSQTDAISLFQDFDDQRNRVITNNLLAGGGYTLYAGANPGKETSTSNIVVTDNRFARLYYQRSGYFGPATAFFDGNGNEWSGNVWDDTGRPVHP